MLEFLAVSQYVQLPGVILLFISSLLQNTSYDEDEEYENETFGFCLSRVRTSKSTLAIIIVQLGPTG